MNYAVTVVVAIYRSEAFIERCAVSLFEQDFDDIEYLFVDDASPDNSIAILEKVIARYPQRAEQVKIIRNVNNIGLFENRKKGVMVASGEYIQHIDADDWVEKTMISTVYQKAKAENADVVACDYYWEDKNGADYRAQRHTSKRSQLLKALFTYRIEPNVWLRLIKRTTHLTLYRELAFTQHLNMAEDWLITFPLYAHFAQHIVYVPCAFYHYNKTNTLALTSNNTDISIVDDMLIVSSFLQSFLKLKTKDDVFSLFNQIAAEKLLVLGFTFDKNIQTILKQFDYTVFSLWQSQLWSKKYKLLYSCYFLHLSWLPRLWKKLKGFNGAD